MSFRHSRIIRLPADYICMLRKQGLLGFNIKI